MNKLDVAQLGQVFSPPEVVERMLSLRKRRGRTLEPSAGDGAFSRMIDDCVSIELDAKVAQGDAIVCDFFAYPVNVKFDTIIGNPPYVRYQDIHPETRRLLDRSMFDGRSNLYLFFIEKAIKHLNKGGELIFIVPREFLKLTAARKLNQFLYEEGTITDFVETGDARIFAGAVPNCAIFRFEKGLFNRTMHDGRIFSIVDGQLLFLSGRYSVPLSNLFDVKVGAVSGADGLFEHRSGNAEFVCSSTLDTGLTRRMLFGVQHAHLAKNKAALLSRRIRSFDEANWWHWGRLHHISEAPRIYVNQKTRRTNPFFTHPCYNYDGSILALFPKDPAMDLQLATKMLNTVVDWDELGFVCDGRFLFGQRTLQTSMLPSAFSILRQSHVAGSSAPETVAKQGRRKTATRVC